MPLQGVMGQRSDLPAQPKEGLRGCCPEGATFELGQVGGVRTHPANRVAVGGGGRGTKSASVKVQVILREGLVGQQCQREGWFGSGLGQGEH